MIIKIDEAETRKNLIKSLNGLGTDMVEALQQSVPIASTWLKDHIEFEVIQEGSKIILELKFPYYFKYVEWGRPPGKQPPIEAIIEWCKDKGIDVKWAYPIAKHIAEHGTRPQPVLRPYIDTKMMTDLERNLAKNFK